ncbi:MAG: hypothetical protein DRG78_07350 [Epsilonproteobacteria bacterium]|nr:MAG: hypothetical protein DRG78_07350 [Campylobacterota bacterium]
MKNLLWIIIIIGMVMYFFNTSKQEKVITKQKIDRKHSLYIDTEPKNCVIKILNIKPKFTQNMKLKTGKYHVEISKEGFKTQKKWIELNDNKTLRIALESKTKKEIVEKIEPKKEIKKPKISLAPAPIGWTNVIVPTQNGSSNIYEVMSYPVSEQLFKKNGNTNSMTAISSTLAEQFCMDNMKANLIKEYVFKAALLEGDFNRPTSNSTREIIVPYDEEDDEIYYVDGETMEVSDTKIILYYWNKKRYKTASSLFKSNSTSFRCMRMKP